MWIKPLLLEGLDFDLDGALIFRLKTLRLKTFRLKKNSKKDIGGGASLTELLNEAFLNAARA